MSLRESRWAWLSLIPALVLFFSQARYGLEQGLFPDDAMNMLGAYRLSWWHALTDPWWPGSGAYRPVGALWYRLLFEWFGYQPWPFHAASFLLQGANLTLLWLLARRLAGNWEGAMMASLFAAYHVYFSDIYASTGTIYDQFCFLFFYSALLVRPHRRWAFALCCVLAANSKELGVLLPAAILAEDLLFGNPRKPDWKSLAIATCVALAFLSRSFIVGGEASRFEEYTPRLNWERFSGNLANYLGLLFLKPGAFSVDQAFTLVALLVFAAVLLRNRVVWFGLTIFFLGLGPALLVPQRSLYMLYVPVGGLALAAGAACAEGLRRIPVAAPLRAGTAAVSFALFWVPLHARFDESARSWVTRDGPLISSFSAAIQRAFPTLPRGARVLFLHDTFTPDDYLIEMSMQLIYRDTTLYIQRVARMGSVPPAAEQKTYAYVLEYDGREVRRVQSPGSITQSSGRPELQ